MSHDLTILTEERPLLETVERTVAGTGFVIDSSSEQLEILPEGETAETRRPILVSLGAHPDSDLYEQLAEDDDDLPDDLEDCKYESSVQSGWYSTRAEIELAAKIAYDLSAHHLGYVHDTQGHGFLSDHRDIAVDQVVEGYVSGAAMVRPQLARLTGGSVSTQPAATSATSKRRPFYRRPRWWVTWLLCFALLSATKIVRFNERTERESRATTEVRAGARVADAPREADDKPELPTYTVTVAADGCSVSRTTTPDEPRGLSWLVLDDSDEQVLSRNARDESRYEYYRSGSYTIGLQAWGGDSYVDVSNRVPIRC